MDWKDSKQCQYYANIASLFKINIILVAVYLWKKYQKYIDIVVNIMLGHKVNSYPDFKYKVKVLYIDFKNWLKTRLNNNKEC